MSRSRSSADDPTGNPLQAVLAQRFAWFGKLPGAGDFVSRRMPYAVQQFWDGWCALGTDALKASSTATGPQVWGDTPTWGFVLPAQPGVPNAQLGVFAPSCDRVGRIFPFVVAAPLVPGQQAVWLERAAPLGLAWGDVIHRAQEARQGIEELDARLHLALAETLASEQEEEGQDEGATLPLGLHPSSLPWADLCHSFDSHGSESYWWSVPPASTGYHTRVHNGTLKAAHFLDLCRSKGSDVQLR